MLVTNKSAVDNNQQMSTECSIKHVSKKTNLPVHLILTHIVPLVPTLLQIIINNLHQKQFILDIYQRGGYEQVSGCQ